MWPRPRRDAAIGYDESSSKVILFGGRAKDNEVFDDTWTYEISSGKSFRLFHRHVLLQIIFGAALNCYAR